MPTYGMQDPLPSQLNLLKLIDSTARIHPNAIALIDSDSEIQTTYDELRQKSNQLARFIMRELNLSKETQLRNPDGDLVIGVCMPPSSDMIISLFAILKAQGAYMPLELDYPDQKVDHVLKDAKPALILSIGEPQSLELLKNDKTNECKIIRLDQLKDQIENECSDGIQLHEFKGFSTSELLTAVLYTSGSTGIKKGVRIPQEATLNRLVWQWRQFPYSLNEVCCFQKPLSFVDCMSEVFGPLLTGHTVVVASQKSRDNIDVLTNVLEKYKIERIVVAVSLLRKFVIHQSRLLNSPLQKLKLWVCSAEELPTDLLQSFFNVFTNNQTIYNFYGSSELMGDVTYIEFQNINDASQKLHRNKVPLGVPISNTAIYILDTNQKQEVAEGVMGEIFVAGSNLFSGYVGKAHPEKTILNPISQEKDEFKVLHATGDWGYFHRGILHYEGRSDSQMKVGGFRVDIQQVQMALHSVYGVEKCCVLCYKAGDDDHQALLGYFTSSSSDASTVNSELSSLLPNFMMPRLFQLDDIPMMVNGKVDRQTLLRMYSEYEINEGN